MITMNRQSIQVRTNSQCIEYTRILTVGQQGATPLVAQTWLYPETVRKQLCLNCFSPSQHFPNNFLVSMSCFKASLILRIQKQWKMNRGKESPWQLLTAFEPTSSVWGEPDGVSSAEWRKRLVLTSSDKNNAKCLTRYPSYHLRQPTERSWKTVLFLIAAHTNARWLRFIRYKKQTLIWQFRHHHPAP